MTKKFGNIINGQEISSGETFLSKNSSNFSDVLGEFPIASLDQVRAACDAAGTAFKTWGKTPAPNRGEVIGRIGAAIAREKEA